MSDIFLMDSTHFSQKMFPKTWRIPYNLYKTHNYRDRNKTIKIKLLGILFGLKQYLIKIKNRHKLTLARKGK